MSPPAAAGRPALRALVILPAEEIGGVETVARDLVGGLPGAVTMITNRSIAHLFEGTGCGIETFEASGCRPGFTPTDRRAVIDYARAVHRAARAADANILVGMTEPAGLLGALVRDLGWGRRPLVTLCHTQLTGLAQRRGHGFSLPERLMLRYVYRRSTALVAVSAGVKEDLVQNHGAPAERFKVIRNGVPPCALPAGGREKVAPARLITVARLSPPKDFNTLLKAFAEVRRSLDAQFFIVGEGPLRGEIDSMAAELGIAGSVVLTGHLAEPAKLLSTADVFVFASHYEGFGKVIIEAMACGLPVVSTDTPVGPAEIIEHEHSGYLVAMGDAAGMAARCLELLTDPAQRARMGQAAKARSLAFSSEKMIAEYAALFEGLVARPGRAAGGRG